MTDPGDLATFLAGYRAHVAAVFAYLMRATAGERERAEDLTQETFSAALAAWRRGQVEDMTLPWLLVVARNKLVDAFRKLDRESQRVGRAEWLHERIESPHDNEDVRACVRRLPPTQRAVIALRFVDDLPVAEVAQLLGKRPGAIDSLQRRAIAQLRTMLEEKADD